MQKSPTMPAMVLVPRRGGHVELGGAGDHGFCFGLADSQSGSAALTAAMESSP
jgi:hypothetical protein